MPLRVDTNARTGLRFRQEQSERHMNMAPNLPSQAPRRGPGWANRIQAWRAAQSSPATAFTSAPEPRSIGDAARGRQLLAGNILLAGELLEQPDLRPWDATMPSPGFEAALHGFHWLDDLAALGTPEAHARAQAWTWDWMERYGRGRGPGWTPDLTGRRLIRWISHAILLLRGREASDSAAFFAVLGRQTLFLSRRWQAASPGLPRFEAICGLIYAGLSLDGMQRHTGPALAALDRDCAEVIDATGGIASRNPEDLLEVLTLLIWAEHALESAGQTPSTAHRAAIARAAPTLRALRHANGALARFHGGGAGEGGRLDYALSASRTKPGAVPAGLAMGYARLAAGRTTVILDASAPPTGPASANAHAGTLAFELTSGRRPLIVNCGSGASFGETWRRAGRATPSHSTLAIDGVSSARLGAEDSAEADLLVTVPGSVTSQRKRLEQGTQLVVSHDGYRLSHGLTHTRNLLMSLDGRSLSAEDMLATETRADRARLQDAATPAERIDGLPVVLRFHLHPDVDAELGMGASAASLALRSGEVWVFRHDGSAVLTLEPSVHLEPGRLKPRPTRQLVLRGRVTADQLRIGWTLAKAQDTPQAVRDLAD